MHVRSRWLMAALLLLLFGVPACAQTSTKEFLPEIDAYVPLNSNVRAPEFECSICFSGKGDNSGR